MLLTLLLASVSAHAAQDVLVPEFTPGTANDFGVSYLIYDSIIYDLMDRGVDVVDADAIRALVGDRADSCSEVSECPDELFDHFPARLAVVGSVTQVADGLSITIELHDPNNAVPVKALSEVIPPGGEYEFSADVAEMVQELLPLLSPRDATTTAPITNIEDDFQDLDDVLDDAFDDEDDGFDDVPVYDPVVEDDKDDRPPSRVLDDDEQRMLGVGNRAYQEYRNAGVPMDMWASDVRLRSFQFSIELLSGIGVGNISDAYDVRVAFDVDQGETLDTFQSRALGGGASFQGGLGLGYHPRAWVETSLLLGFQRGSKDLSVGWESYSGADKMDEFSHSYAAASSWQFSMEPRGRFFALTTGVVKPYGLGGLSVRILDGYEVPESGLVDYPDQAGGAMLDLVVGAGVMFDASEYFSVFLELPFGFGLTQLEDTLVESAALSATPDTNDPSRTLLRISAGVQSRF